MGLIDHPGRLGNTRQGADTEDSQQEAEAVAAAAAGGAGASLGGGGLRVEVLGECPKPCDPILADLLEGEAGLGGREGGRGQCGEGEGQGAGGRAERCKGVGGG